MTDTVRLIERLRETAFAWDYTPAYNTTPLCGLLREAADALAAAERSELPKAWAEMESELHAAEAERDRLAAELAEARKMVESLVLRASRKPLDIDISDFGDEFCLGYLAGQENALLVADRALAAVSGRQQEQT